jgi:hypothetical protein
MVSPGRTALIRSPRDWTRPAPSVTCRVCPRAWECHAFRAPGANRTTLTRIRDGSVPRAMTSNQASPVKVAAGALVVGCFGKISNVGFLWGAGVVSVILP